MQYRFSLFTLRWGFCSFCKSSTCKFYGIAHNPCQKHHKMPCACSFKAYSHFHKCFSERIVCNPPHNTLLPKILSLSKRNKVYTSFIHISSVAFISVPLFDAEHSPEDFDIFAGVMTGWSLKSLNSFKAQVITIYYWFLLYIEGSFCLFLSRILRNS